MKDFLSEMRERRGIEEERDNLKREINDLQKGGVAAKAENERIKVEMNIVRVNAEKARKIVKERLERTERDLIREQKQVSDLRDKMKEYERRFGYLEDIRREEEEREKKEREVRERDKEEREYARREVEKARREGRPMGRGSGLLGVKEMVVGEE